MSKHTPGPWIWAEQKKGLYGAGPNNAVLAFYDYEGMHLSGITEDVEEANACLIAGAPDLLAACKTLVEWHGTRDNYEKLHAADDQGPEIRAAMIAIAKAEGEL